MKKISLLIAVCALFLALPIVAQPTRQHQHGADLHFKLVGVWQQVNVVTDSTGTDQYVYLPSWKVLGADGHFVNFVTAYHKAPSFITTEGRYRMVSDKYYSERITNSLTNPQLQGVEVMMEYALDEQKGEMTLRFMLPNSERPVKEIWRKAQLAIPEQLQRQP
ncbi:MAG: DUF4488 domain-containing protein [Bacteroidaceae bacterium]|nr:DUF4488 domain-containing protein [Bacteroidaceae bacterium]